MNDIPTLKLNDGLSLPAVGLGTFTLNGAEGAESVASAIDVGYRLIDTALAYRNEDAVGDGIRRSGIDRSKLVVTSKVSNKHHGRARTKESLHSSLDSLQLDYLDLYLIHWPQPDLNLYVETFEAMVELKEAGLVRSVGVCNFSAEQLDEVSAASGLVPSVNQISVNTFAPAGRLREQNARRGVLTESWTPLGPPEATTTNLVLRQIGNEHGVSVSQIVLRWHIQNGAVPIPMSHSSQHRAENLDVFSFVLNEDEMAKIASLGDESN